MALLKRAVAPRPWGAVARGLCAALPLGCAHAEPAAAPPQTPAAAAEAAAPAAEKAPDTTLHVSATPIEALRSAYFVALELSFENPGGEWHEVRRVEIGPERQMFGPALELPLGARLRAWQLAARDAWQGKAKPADGPPHVALETLAADPPAAGEAGGAAAGGVPPQHVLAGPFIVAPGLVTRKWVVLYSSAKDALLGQDLMLAYELEKGKVERVLLQYPKPAADAGH